MPARYFCFLGANEAFPLTISEKAQSVLTRFRGNEMVQEAKNTPKGLK